MKTQLNIPKLVLAVALIFIGTNTFAQTTWHWYLYTNNSDYKVTGNFTISSGCDCTDKYGFSIFLDNFLPSNLVVSSSKKKSDYTIVTGPDASHKYLASMSVKGKNDWTIFDCFNTCESSGRDDFTVTTKPIKKPYGGTGTTNQDYIKITWKKGTNIPNSKTKYIIARDDPKNVIATVNGSTFEYTDQQAGPGGHIYYVSTRTDSWGGHTSGALQISGYALPKRFDVSKEFPEKVTLTWDDLSNVTSEFVILRDGEEIESRTDIDDSDTTFTDREPSLLPGYQYRYTLNWSDGVKDYELEANGGILPNGRIKGKVVTPGSRLPVENVLVCAELENEIEQGSPGTTYCDSTDANGQYEIRQIYYHREATFKVSASKPEHGFDPAFYTDQLLELSRPDITNLDFQDTTSFLVAGYVNQELNGVVCGIGDVEIWVNGIYKGVKTDAEGYYEFLVEESGDYSIEPRFREHRFVPNKQDLRIESKTNNVNFTDTNTNRLRGKVLASCDIYIGNAMVRAFSEGGVGCIDTLIPTNSLGYYEAILPARTYEVEVVSFTPKDDVDLAPEQVTGYYQTQSADLLDENQTLDFIYRNPPSIQVSGLPEINCSDLAYSIVEQDELYQIDIEVREAFGAESCPVEKGYVLVYDEASDKANEPDSIPIVDGLAVYEMRPGAPNLVAPYRKLLQIEAVVDEERSNWSESIVVTGVRPREQTFATVSPEVPLMILHDPPGDASYSYFAKNNTSKLAMRTYGKATGSLSLRKQVKLGSAFNQTIFPGTTVRSEVWGTVGSSFTVGASIASSAEWIMSMTNSEQFKTSNSDQITGEEGDVFIGAAMNLIYAQADILTYDPATCSINKDIDLIMGNDGFSTTFMYTEEHVSKSLLPQLAGIRDFYEGQGSDSAKIYENQIAVWQQVLDQNRKNKSKASFIENRSFSAGATYASSVTSSTEGTLSVDVSLFMEESIVLGAGYEVAGSGVQGSVEAKMRFEIGASISGTLLEERTTGFELKDDDPGDFFSVDIKKDPVYGTPVFNMLSGRSSCPWEPGTQPRETVQLQADSYFQKDIVENEAAVFQLSLANISQSDEARTYLLRFLQETNPDGAFVTIGGSEAQSAIPFNIGPANDRKATVTVRKGPRATDYQGLRFVLGSGCDDASISDTIALNVSFENAYPALLLNQPMDNWMVNTGSNDELLVWFQGFDQARVKKVQLQYSPKDRYEWTLGKEWQSGALPSNNSVMATRWDVSELADGMYDIRMRADYGDSDSYSTMVTGRIDRKAPRTFGLPAPSDGVYNGGEVISISFDEDISCFAVSQENIRFRNTADNSNIPFEIGCSGKTLIINPLWNVTEQIGKSFEIEVNSISDLHENVSVEPTSWSFTVEDPDETTPILDTDLDGIPDIDDNCDFAANPDQSDIDGDGIGDSCDEDIDGDGIKNEQDNCPYFSNPDQNDRDNNGIGDACEPDADGDGDGIINQDDNCPYTPNPDQADQDQDGIGDACDDDKDGDGIRDDLDNCPDTPNPDQEDLNADAVGDICSSVVSTSAYALGLNEIRIQPNPAQSQTQLFMDLEDSGEWMVVLLQLDGRVLQQYPSRRLSAGTHTLDLNLETVPPGIYFLQLRSEKGSLSRKLIRTR